ncbi:MAG: glycosyltransferase family 39 protein [Holosporaceae bacterium]|jgi:4-amino-4-deoxy-L-arabinose transferase-like glycosyltransferase|nr:glycosyltransferase family 39 protein [Holosporaceae bacterium]
MYNQYIKRRELFFLGLIFLVFFSYEIGNRHFADPDEGRYVEIPREMVVSGDYVTPRLNGLKYFEKPALFYWLQAAAIKIFEINEISMRMWTVFFAILGCLFVFGIGTRFYSRDVGLISSGILATNLIYYVHSRLIVLDLVASILVSGSLWCFFSLFVSKNAEKTSRKKIIIAMYALSALACLTKGLIGAVLPGLIAFLWMIFSKNIRKIKEIFYIPGILTFLVIFLPWHIVVALRNHDFLHFYFVIEHFLRYTTRIHDRYQEWWFFIPVVLVGLFPWTDFCISALKDSILKAVKGDSENIFFSCWILGIFTFFSLSNSKLIPYILPIIPPIALITGIKITELLEKSSASFENQDTYTRSNYLDDYQKAACHNILWLSAVFCTCSIFKSKIPDALRSEDANIFLGLIIVAIALFIFSIFNRRNRKIFGIIYIFTSASMLLMFNKVAAFYQEVRRPTTKYSAQIINRIRRKDDLVFCYKRYYQDFPVYLNSTVGVVDFVGELEFGAKSEKDNDKLIGEEDFWKLWQSTQKRIFLLLSRENYRHVSERKDFSHVVLDINKYFVVITNK